MPGQIKANGASVWVRTLAPSKVEVRIDNEEGNLVFGPVYTTEETDLSAVVEVDGLKPAIKYAYKVIVNGKTISPEVEQTIMTLPEDNQSEEVKIAFGEFTFLPSDKDPAVVFRLVGEDGQNLFEKTVRKSELTP
ncbi:hypothetical protein ADICYQ_4024 [Cyclobacterium qasimii M12-11B]|uniref:DUF7800 domain-containing protein n=2 Tax=Cyclobacterium qasimii TaxID=1350429 RepID=S7WS62_9BACT|nr:hypothetical protein [Cyclobacterium qasimii]EPR66948.1 hypothetical protein ADICYQ_4024 [Cyclobacterium qasimii M12-11B]GEO20202.1 hypothetical protein CQA01_07360 [Cyclobacterium qasimii]